MHWYNINVMQVNFTIVILQIKIYTIKAPPRPFSPVVSQYYLIDAYKVRITQNKKLK